MHYKVAALNAAHGEYTVCVHSANRTYTPSTLHVVHRQYTVYSKCLSALTCSVWGDHAAEGIDYCQEYVALPCRLDREIIIRLVEKRMTIMFFLCQRQGRLCSHSIQVTYKENHHEEHKGPTHPLDTPMWIGYHCAPFLPPFVIMEVHRLTYDRKTARAKWK